MIEAQQVATDQVVGGRFQLNSVLIEDARGTLYRAIDQHSQKDVALRVLAPNLAADEAIVATLREHVKAASTLAHKNIAKVFGLGQEGGLRFIAGEFVDGHSLRHAIERKRAAGKTFSYKGAYNVLAHVANALDEAHHVMAHGLPGPSSILINKAGRVKVCDFGFVSALPASSALLSSIPDAQGLAPELVRDPRRATAATDIFSLGAVLHELLTGHPPGVADALAAADVSPEVVAVVMRCLAANPAQRFAHPQELKAAFYAAIDGAGVGGSLSQTGPAAVGGRPPGPPPAPGAPRPGGPPLVAVATAPAPLGMGGAGLNLGATGPQIMGPQVAAGQPPLGQPPLGQPPLGQPPLGQGLRAVPSNPGFNPLQGHLGPAAQPMGQGRPLSIQDLLADGGDGVEKWLIQKDRLDFGPFSLGDVKQQLYRGEFTGDDVIVDKETGERTTIRRNPELAAFIPLLERHQQEQAAAHNENEAQRRDKRRHTLMVTIVSVSLVLAAGIGFAVWFLVLRQPPDPKEKIVYRDRPGGNLSIKVAFNREPEEQAKRRRALKRRRPKRRHGETGGVDDGVTRLGDATHAGGDGLLSQFAIQQVMAAPANFKRLTPCVQQQWRRQPSLRSVAIAFGVTGAGDVKFAKVNGQTSGPFQSCIYRQMKAIKFPKYDGALTRASFTMSLGY